MSEQTNPPAESPTEHWGHVEPRDIGFRNQLKALVYPTIVD